MPCSAEQIAVAVVEVSLVVEALAEGTSEEVHLVAVVPQEAGNRPLLILVAPMTYSKS